MERELHDHATGREEATELVTRLRSDTHAHRAHIKTVTVRMGHSPEKHKGGQREKFHHVFIPHAVETMECPLEEDDAGMETHHLKMAAILRLVQSGVVREHDVQKLLHYSLNSLYAFMKRNGLKLPEERGSRSYCSQGEA